MVTFELFARPVLEALAGMTPRKLIFLHAKLKSEIKTKPGLKRFLPATLSGEFDQAEVELVRWQGSGDIAATGTANCYIVIPPDRERVDHDSLPPLRSRRFFTRRLRHSSSTHSRNGSRWRCHPCIVSRLSLLRLVRGQSAR